MGAGWKRWLLVLAVVVFACGFAFAQDAAGGDARLVVARGLVAKGDFKAAEVALRGMLSADGKPVEAEYLLGYVLLRLNRPKESLEVYTRAAALRTPSAEELKGVADDYVLLSDFPDADKWMLRAVRMNGKDADLWYGLGRIRYSLQRYEDAVNCFRKALELAPRSVKAEDNLGLAYRGLNRREDAMAAFKQALEWQKDAARQNQPLSEQPMLNLAVMYADEGQYDEAVPLLLQAVAIAPDDARIHEQLGQAYAKKDRLEEARREFERAVELAPDQGAYHYLLGRVYHRLGLEEQSKAELSRAGVLNGTHSTPE